MKIHMGNKMSNEFIEKAEKIIEEKKISKIMNRNASLSYNLFQTLYTTFTLGTNFL
jgi:hypothetical protein